jgi:hypothetical protein
LRIFARAKADNSTYSVASLRKLVNAPPSHNPPMRNKTWQLTMLLRTIKRLQTATTTYIYSTMVLKAFWLDVEWGEQRYNYPLSRFHGPGASWRRHGDTSKIAFSQAGLN